MHAELRRQPPKSRRCCRRGSRTCSSTAARASPSAWPPTSRRTTSARSSTPRSTCIDNPEATPDDLMQFVKGPDFPTGGSILGRAGIIDAYRTGRGSVKMRAKADDRRGARRGAMQIVVTELPYQTSCSAIAGRIQELVDGGDLDGIADVNDGSAGGKTNLVITLKRDANANVVLNNLFKLTQLQTSFASTWSRSSTACRARSTSRQALQGYIDHQVDVITRRTAVPPRQGQASRAHPRGPHQGAQRDRRDHRPHPRQRRRRRGQGRPDGRAVRVQRDPGHRHPRHAAAPAHPAVSRIDLETELDDVRATIVELEAILADPSSCAASSRTRCRAIKEEFATPRGLPDRPRRRRDDRSRTSSTTRSSSSS